MAGKHDEEPAFASVGKEGMTVWRIEDKLPVLITEKIGKFHVGDCYLVLVSTKKASSSSLNHKIHFWLGDECSVDEKGIVAYKAVELDDKLGGTAVHHRETQAMESDLFCSYFKASGGIEYLPGGVDSGFTHVERDVFPTRLLMVKGKRNCRVKEVPNEKSSLNTGDVFILDMGLELFIFCGPDSNKYEKAKGLTVLTQINNDRGARATIVYMEDEPENPTFWDNFGGYVDPSTLPAGEDDDSVPAFAAPKLLRVCDASGSATVEELPVPGGKLDRAMLDTKDAFIIIAQGKCFVWVGKECTATEKKEASKAAMTYIDSPDSGCEKGTSMERTAEGVESSAFRSLFAVWTPQMSIKQMRQCASTQEQPDIAIAEILAAQEEQEKPIESDPGSDKITIFTIENFELSQIEDSMIGQFFSGDSYVIQYEYEVRGRKQAVLFFWLGNESTTDEKGAAALQTKNLDDTKFGGSASQIRVVQGKEPATLRSLFKGSLIVHTGGLASGFKNKNETSSKDEDGVALFHVRGTNSLNTCGVQVEEKACELNGEDCFVLVTPSEVYVWKGNAANDEEVEVASNIGKKLADGYLGESGRTVTNITEGGEPDAFWTTLGGKADYPAFAPGSTPPPRAPRLFEVSDKTGVVAMSQVAEYTQSDLANDDVFILDVYSKIYVWVGNEATRKEREAATDLASRFLSEANDGRDPDAPVISVTAGNEPSSFSAYFQSWDHDYISKQTFMDPYAAKLAASKAQQIESAPQRMASLKKVDAPASRGSTAPPPAPEPEPTAPAPAPAAAAEMEAPVPGKYTLAELQAGLPAGVKPHEKELWLSDADFETALKMGRAAFDGLAGWKKNNAKKAAGIY